MVASQKWGGGLEPRGLLEVCAYSYASIRYELTLESLEVYDWIGFVDSSLTAFSFTSLTLALGMNFGFIVCCRF